MTMTSELCVCGRRKLPDMRQCRTCAALDTLGLLHSDDDDGSDDLVDFDDTRPLPPRVRRDDATEDLITRAYLTLLAAIVRVAAYDACHGSARERRTARAFLDAAHVSYDNIHAAAQHERNRMRSGIHMLSDKYSV